MHNSIIYSILLHSSYALRHGRHPRGAYTKISLKHTATHNLQ